MFTEVKQLDLFQLGNPFTSICPTPPLSKVDSNDSSDRELPPGTGKSESPVSQVRVPAIGPATVNAWLWKTVLQVNTVLLMVHSCFLKPSALTSKV